MTSSIYEPLTDVKPCPFCGKTESIRIMTEYFFNEVSNKHDDSLVDMECKACSASLKVYPSDAPDKTYNERREILIAKWNRRGGRKA